MASKAHAAETGPTAATPHPQGGTLRETGGDTGALKTFCITHVRRSHPNKVQIDRIAASDNADAARRAALHFPDSTVLRVCRSRQGQAAPSTPAAPAPTADAKTDARQDPPNARFIRGEFRPADTEDEPTLRDLCD